MAREKLILFLWTHKRTDRLQMPVFSFRTIQDTAEAVYKDKGSKFYAYAFPVQSEAEIKQHLELLKKTYFDASHHCFAWVLGADKKRFRAFDAGEPNHTAGDPILGQIRSKDLTDILVVVIRYFGGVKLGVGGLIHAYRSAAENVLSTAAIVEKEVAKQMTLLYAYDATAEVMRLVKECQADVLQQKYDDQCHLKVSVSIANIGRFKDRVSTLNLTGSLITLLTDDT